MPLTGRGKRGKTRQSEGMSGRAPKKGPPMERGGGERKRGGWERARWGPEEREKER